MIFDAGMKMAALGQRRWTAGESERLDKPDQWEWLVAFVRLLHLPCAVHLRGV